MTRSDGPRVQLAQVRFVSTAIEPIAAFYAALLDVSVPLNEHYLEVPAGSASIGFSKVGFTEDRGPHAACRTGPAPKRERSFSISPPTTSTPNICVSTPLARRG